MSVRKISFSLKKTNAPAPTHNGAVVESHPEDVTFYHKLVYMALHAGAVDKKSNLDRQMPALWRGGFLHIKRCLTQAKKEVVSTKNEASLADERLERSGNAY